MNAGTSLGFGEFKEDRGQGARQTAPLVYPLDEITVKTSTLMRTIKLVWSQAVGVQLDDRTEIPGKVVTVAAGAYRWPYILMLFGIGPRDTLVKQGIKVNVENPDIRRNFNDHVTMKLD